MSIERELDQEPAALTYGASEEKRPQNPWSTHISAACSTSNRTDAHSSRYCQISNIGYIMEYSIYVTWGTSDLLLLRYCECVTHLQEGFDLSA